LPRHLRHFTGLAPQFWGAVRDSHHPELQRSQVTAEAGDIETEDMGESHVHEPVGLIRAGAWFGLVAREKQ